MWGTVTISFKGEVRLDNQIQLAQLIAPTVYIGSENMKSMLDEHKKLIQLPTTKKVLFTISKKQTWETNKQDENTLVQIRQFQICNLGPLQMLVGDKTITKGQYSDMLECSKTISIRLSLGEHNLCTILFQGHQCRGSHRQVTRNKSMDAKQLRVTKQNNLKALHEPFLPVFVYTDQGVQRIADVIAMTPVTSLLSIQHTKVHTNNTSSLQLLNTGSNSLTTTSSPPTIPTRKSARKVHNQQLTQHVSHSNSERNSFHPTSNDIASEYDPHDKTPSIKHHSKRNLTKSASNLTSQQRCNNLLSHSKKRSRVHTTNNMHDSATNNKRRNITLHNTTHHTHTHKHTDNASDNILWEEDIDGEVRYSSAQNSSGFMNSRIICSDVCTDNSSDIEAEWPNCNTSIQEAAEQTVHQDPLPTLSVENIARHNSSSTIDNIADNIAIHPQTTSPCTGEPCKYDCAVTTPPMKFGKYKLIHNTAHVLTTSPPVICAQASNVESPPTLIVNTHSNLVGCAQPSTVVHPRQCLSALQLLSDLAEQQPSINTPTFHDGSAQPNDVSVHNHHDMHNVVTVLCALSSPQNMVGQEVAKFYPNPKFKKSLKWRLYRGTVQEVWTPESTDDPQTCYYKVAFNDGDESDWDVEQLRSGLALQKVSINYIRVPLNMVTKLI